MGAVQKLATVVIVGLVALATALVVYLADDPTRRDAEAGEQDHLAIERGTDLYITYCLQCHGPLGYGSLGNEEPRRVGGILNQDPIPVEDRQVNYQSDNPADQALAEEFIRYRLLYGVPADPREDEEVIMPAFGEELNVEEINDLVHLIMYGDWNYVYNESLLTTGEGVAQAECDATPPGESAEENAEQCARVEDPEPVYPTVPATPVPEGEDAAAASEGSNQSESGGTAGGGQVLEALDPAAWSVTELTFAPGDSFQAVNAGVSQHNFVVDELGIEQDLTGDPVTITIPEDAPPGTYQFYCSIPGHAQLGMVGTLTITG
jgi:mono/diheme cytochrome c family protein/plastocyanin